MNLENLLEQQGKLFSSKQGLNKDQKEQISFSAGSQTKIFRHRAVPFALKHKVEEELSTLMNQGFYCPGEPTQRKYMLGFSDIFRSTRALRDTYWADFKLSINKYVQAGLFPILQFKFIISNLSGGEKFAVIFLNGAYKYQCQITRANISRLQPTVVTLDTKCYHLECHVHHRYSKTMSEFLSGIRGVSCYLDDIVITGRNNEEHLTYIQTIFMRLEQCGLTRQVYKFKFVPDKIKYLGNVIYKNGIFPTTESIGPIMNCPEPTNTKELK
ncbi:Retrovirus-related Pol polyprotein [Thelohanellus kitauei]|uniref:Retrovirus-related Pol polyprotein n=1 Tax=Thelohanellus kitauei TaxID=669202 RepID=A0A0C2INL7_THEKT|nr:Retrovirus-related Pol polyprotein [Thelohanellus kitauei]